MKTFLPNQKPNDHDLKIIKDIMTNNRKLAGVLQKYWVDTGKTKAKSLKFKDLMDMIKTLAKKAGAKPPSQNAKVKAMLGFVVWQVNALVQKGMIEEGTGLRYYTDEELEMIHQSEVIFRWVLEK